MAQGQVNSGTAVPYQRIIEPSQLGLFLNLEQAELLRIRRYHEHWRFYTGQHWAFTREGGEPLVTLNYARRCIDKSVSWLVGAGLTLTVPEVFRKHTLPAILEVYDYNGLLSVDSKGEQRPGKKLYDIATMGAVTGDVFILVTYADPTSQAKRINPHTRGQIKLQVLNSEQVYPQWDPLDTSKLTSVRIETVYYDDRAQQIEDSYDHQARQLHVRRFTQIITPTQIIEQYQGQQPVVQPNLLGEIPLVHIPNHSLPGEYYGLADLDSLLDLQREMNEKCTDVSDIVNYHAAPIIAITGAKVKQLERSPQNIWSGFPADARVNVINTQADLGAAAKYIDMIKKSFLEIAEIPEGALGGMQPISNTSGVALHTQYQPLVEKTNRKRALYEPGLTDVNYYILRILEVTNPSFKLPTDLCINCGGRIVEFIDVDPECPYCEGHGQVNKDGRPAPTEHIGGAMDDQFGHPDVIRCPCVTSHKKCYRIDEQTFEFLSPEDVKVRYARQHSFGTKIEEAPFKQVVEEHEQHAPSEWDPAKTQSMEDKAKEDQPDPEPSPDGSAPAAEPTPKPELPQLPASAIELPPEPETIKLRRLLVDPTTGAQYVSGEKEIQVVPTTCDHCEYANPYEVKTSFNDPLPKDQLQQANLYGQWLGLGLVSKAWCRRNTPELAPDADRIEKELKKERSEEPQQPAPGKPPGQQLPKTPKPARPIGAGQGQAGDEQARMDSQGATNIPRE
jgi:hypothetical protein